MLDVTPAAPFPSTTTTDTGGRLIPSFVFDPIKSAFLSQLDVPESHLAIKNRNMTTACESNVWHLVANKWNDLFFASNFGET